MELSLNINGTSTHWTYFQARTAQSHAPPGLFGTKAWLRDRRVRGVVRCSRRQAVNSCVMLAAQAQGHSIQTIE